ncbi:hypothetical protein N8920_01825 [Opitutales bacterium]|nr:hypothetical protein [Opitutales bacterium]
MKFSIKKLLSLASILSIAFFLTAAKKSVPVNAECPFSGKAVKADKVAIFNVCCTRCAKKASSDVKALVKKVKAGNDKCPISNKPAKKQIVVGFCCGNCVDKASS